MGICFWGCAFWCFLIVRYVKGSAEASKLEYLENIRGDSEQMGPQELRVTSHHIQTSRCFSHVVLHSSTDTMTSKSIDGKDRCALHCCLRSEYKPIAFRRLSKPSELVDFSPHPPPLCVRRPPLEPAWEAKERQPWRWRWRGRSAFYSPTLGHLGMIPPNLPMIPGFGHDVRSLMLP